jgi:hypothetical protein
VKRREEGRESAGDLGLEQGTGNRRRGMKNEENEE